MSLAVGRHDQPGIALVVVLMVLLVIGALSTSAALVSSNAWVINSYDERQSVLEAAADDGLEEARARINGDDSLYPASGYATLEDGVTVLDADSNAIRGVRRYTYVGPSGTTTGQYGVFGSIVVVAEDGNGDRVIRRAEVAQESFARFAYFTDFEPSNIAFGGGDQIFGPVHTNSDMSIYSSRATFHGPVTVGGTISGRQYGDFRQGYTERAQTIPMPETADLDNLRDYATPGQLAFTSSSLGGEGRARMRIEFIAIDLNGDGDRTDANEGFIRVYTSDDDRWVVADVPDDYNSEGMENSPNCGHYHLPDSIFVATADHPDEDNWMASLTNHGRCYLGGADSLFGEFRADDAMGRWLEWPGAISPLVTATGRADSAYLFPISRSLNPNFSGVIFVDGKVAISGVLRGQVTLAATDDIIIADDLIYATDPGASGRTCDDPVFGNYDILGLFGGNDILVADNTINAPTRPRKNGSGSNYRSFDDTPEERIHAVVLALSEFRVVNYASGSTRTEDCGTTQWGRGCLFLTGGIIQSRRGPVGTSAGTGYLKRYSYDTCAASAPPPYFPTTGHFARGRYFEVDPAGFDIDQLFAELTPAGGH